MKNIQVYCKDFSITEAINTHIEDKLSRVMENKGFEKLGFAITIKKEGHQYESSIKTHLKGHEVIVSEVGSEMYSTFDKSAKKVEQHLKDFFDKRDTKRKHQMNVAGYDEDMEFEDLSEDEKIKLRIVKRKSFDQKPMGEVEAVLQMDALNHNSFVFLNDDTGTICMIYKRKDGEYGLIDTEY